MGLEEFVIENYDALSDTQISDKFQCEKGRVRWIRRKYGLLKKPGVTPILIAGRISKEIHFDNICSEMKTLIRFCEMTDSKHLKRFAMNRLKTLSGIPIDNPFADRTVGK